MITTPLLDDFNRSDEDPLSQSGKWTGPVGGGTWFWVDASVKHRCRLHDAKVKKKS